MITCPNCGRRNTNEARNCDQCGTALKEEQAERGELQTSSVELAANRSSPPDSHSISQRKEIPMQKWEYKFVFVNGKGDELYVDGELVARGKNIGTRARFQQLGQQGWELVAAVSESVANGGGIGTIWGGVSWYFKRPQE